MIKSNCVFFILLVAQYKMCIGALISELTDEPKTFIRSDIYPYEMYEDPGKKCMKEGIMCESCDSSALCVAISGGFEKIPLEDCDVGNQYKCMDVIGCTNRTDIPCNAPEFSCSSVGVFPDPFDCQAYHFCAPDGPNSDTPTENSVPAVCPGRYVYDPMTTFCRGTRCDRAPIRCDKIGRIGPLSQYPATSYYYICKAVTGFGLYPQLRRCEHGEIFSNSRCN